MKGTIVENSLADKSVLTHLNIIKTWKDDDWTLHDVIIDESEITMIQKALSDGPWYVHFWGNDTIVVIYKDKIFYLKESDKETWKDAIEHGRVLGIPDEQLDFITH